jgi:DNA repair protein RadA/Sms
VAKARAVFFCSACGFETPRWLGRCPSCEGWNTFTQATPLRPAKSRATRAASAPAAAPLRLADVASEAARRIRSGLDEFDALLGGGVVPGSVVLIGGAPGAGKSTLMLQLADGLASRGGPVVYVCGEESAAQVRLRAARLGAGDELLVFPETNLGAVLEAVEPLRPRALVVDSIQTVWLPEVESSAGNAVQLRECAQRLVEYAKRTSCAVFVVGHVTKEGAIAGPRLLEHLVDTVLYFEGEASGEFRILRATKNRFGSVDEICVFTMDGRGLHEVTNPSRIFVGAQRNHAASGACILSSVVGSRPVLVEIQALVADAAYGTPRRLAANLDQSRLAMILAVLERRAGLHLGGMDVYASVAGGLRITEPAADLGIALALASALRDRALPRDLVAFGEIGLSGEVRRVSQSSRRLAEARKLGFTRAIAPADRNTPDGVADIDAALSKAFS